MSPIIGGACATAKSTVVLLLLFLMGVGGVSMAPPAAAQSSPNYGNLAINSAKLLGGADIRDCAYCVLSLRLPSGSQIYLWGMDAGGFEDNNLLSTGTLVKLITANGTLAGQLGESVNDSTSFFDGSAHRSLGGVGVSGFANRTFVYASNTTKGARSVSLTFVVPTPSLVVVMALQSGGPCETDFSMQGLPNEQLDGAIKATTEICPIVYGSPTLGPQPMIIAHSFLPQGTYVVSSSVTLSSPQDADYINLFEAMIGAWIFSPSFTTSSSSTTSSTTTGQSSSANYGELAINSAKLLGYRTSLQLPGGSQIYLWGMDAGGAHNSMPLSTGTIVKLVNANGTLSGQLGESVVNSTSFVTDAFHYSIGGFGVSGFFNRTFTYTANTTSGAGSVSVSFTVHMPSLVVVIALQSGGPCLTSFSMQGLPNEQVDGAITHTDITNCPSDTFFGSRQPMIMAHSFLLRGTYVVNSSVTPVYPDNKVDYASLIGVWIFAPSFATSSSTASSTTTTTQSSSATSSSTLGTSHSSASASTSAVSSTSIGATTSVATSATTSNTGTQSGGIPEFPYQVFALGLVMVIVVASYLLVRNRVQPGNLFGRATT